MLTTPPNPDPDPERLRTQRRRVVRHYQPFTSEQRANHAASHRLGPRQRHAVGTFFWTHPDVPGIAFDSRGRAARAAITAQDRQGQTDLDNEGTQP